MLSTRRGWLAGGVAVAAGTVAFAAWLGKPSAPVVLHAAGPPEGVRLEGMDRLVPTDPPAPPPPATFQDAGGATHSLADFAGKGLVVNLWATWCAPCVAELPALAVLARRAAADGIVVLPLSSDRGGADVVRRFYDTHAIEGLGVWLDPKGEVQRAWGARGVPTTVIIDRQGRERARYEGPADWASDAALAEIRRLTA